MADVIKGFAGDSLSFLVAWLLPALITLGAFVLFIFPSIKDIGFASSIASFDSRGTAALLIGTAFTLAFVMNTASGAFYRILEGYLLWPEWFYNRRVARWTRAKDAVWKGYRASREGLRGGLNIEQTSRFPIADNQVAPTRFGNAIRAFEVYGAYHWGLDQQVLWGELWAVTPQALRDEHDHARAGVDFCVAMFWAGILFGMATLASAGLVWHSGDHNWALIVVGLIVPILIGVIFYRLATSGSADWGVAVQAIVNTGRVPLAEAMGLVLPPTHKLEREMWAALKNFVLNVGLAGPLGTAPDTFDVNATPLDASALEPFRKRYVRTVKG